MTDEAIEDVVVDDDAPVEDAPEVEAPPEVEPETYTREQLAELLGPRFERFASHEGEEAFRQYGQAYDSATGLIRQGAHLEPQDASVYEQIGLDPSEVYQPEPEVEPGPQIYGAPWEAPQSWDEHVQYAQSESPEQRRLAAYSVLQSEGADQPTRQWFYNQWHQLDPYGASAYIQQSTLTAAEQRIADMQAQLESSIGAANADLVNRNANDLMEVAKAQVPGFVEHAKGVLALWDERKADDPTYADRFLAAPRDKQIRELTRLTIIAAAESAPERQAAQAQSQADTQSAKLRARTETSRTSGAPESPVDESTRNRREAMRRVGARIT